MRQVRHGVFETNSSSTHSIVICTKEQYKLFGEKEMMYDRYSQKLVPYSELLIKTEPYRYRCENDFGSDLEYYYHPFTTPSGDEMVAFGEYGYDG